jgi:hypothetical protein
MRFSPIAVIGSGCHANWAILGGRERSAAATGRTAGQVSVHNRWQSERQRDILVHEEFAALRAPLRFGQGNHVVHSRFGRCPNARRSRQINTTLDDKAGDPWQIIADLQRKLDARTAELQENEERYALVSQAEIASSLRSSQ